MVSLLTNIFAELLGDQQEADKYTAESCVCHRCKAPRKEYLKPDHFDSKSMIATRKKVQKAAEGTAHQCIVQWDTDGRNVRPGPGATIIVIIGIIGIFVIMVIIAIIAIILTIMS